MKLTMIALVFACIVGGVSAGCYSGYSACRSACSPCVNSAALCGGYGWTCGGAVAPVVRTVAVAPVVKRVVVVKVEPAYWGAWGAFSGCSTSCGTGTKSRIRACYRGQVRSNDCVGPAKEVVACTDNRGCAPVVVKTVVHPVVRHVAAVAPVVAAVGGCADVALSCGSWVGAGFCGSYPSYMATNCCNSCSGLISAYIKEKENPEHLKLSDEKTVQMMNEEMKNMRCRDCKDCRDC